MSQIRYWNNGESATSEKLRATQIGLHKKGVYARYGVVVTAPDTVLIGANGFALLPDGVAVTETFDVRLQLRVLATAATEYTITARHTENNLTYGAAVVYAFELGHLTNDDITNGIVLAWVSYPGGGVALTDSMITLPPLVGDGVIPGGFAGGDLTGSYPNPEVAGIRTVVVNEDARDAVEGDILRVGSDGEYHAVAASSIAGDGIPSANFNVLGVSTDYSPPTNFIDGFREFGVAGQIAQVVMSQETAGSSGTTVVELYKIDAAGVETQVSATGSISLPYTAGNNARMVSTSFLTGTNTFTATDRLGVKVTSLQVNGEDVSVNVVVAGASLPAPVLPSVNTHTTQSMMVTILGSTPTFAGSVYLPAGTLLASQSRISFGATLPADSARFQLRRMSDGAIVYDVTKTGVSSSTTPAGNIIIPTEGFYEMWLSSPSGGIAMLTGIHLVWTSTSGLNFDYSAFESNIGTVPADVGTLYLSPGTLQGTTQVVLSASGAGTPTAYLELRRPDTAAVIATFTSSGAGGREVVTIPGPVYVPVAGFYTLSLYGDVITTITGFHGFVGSVVV